MKNNSKRNIVFYGGKFGLEFSGGCIATCRIFEQIQTHFEEIIVLCAELGSHHIQNLRHIPCSSIENAVPILRSFAKDKHIFYGDFYDAIAMVKAEVPFYFTYHDNWPEQSELSQEEADKADYFISIYNQIFKAANKVFTVSNYKSKFISQYTDRIALVRNGLNHPIQNEIHRPYQGIKSLSILMTGNIDARKYEKALLLFEALYKLDINIQIDIFGWQHDQAISEKLAKYDFVQLKGYQPNIYFKDYHLYLSTSFIENLSISVVEALKNYLPVVCFDVGGLGEVVNENNGCLIPAFEIETMTQAIKNVFDRKTSFEFNTTDLSDFDWEVAGQRFLSNLINDQLKL